MTTKKMLILGVLVVFAAFFAITWGVAKAKNGLSPFVLATPSSGLDKAGGPLQKYLVAAMAEAMGIKSDDLQKRIDAGERLWDIAKSMGISADDFKSKMDAAFNKAVEAALADKAITEDQANWLRQRAKWRKDNFPFGMRNEYIAQAMENVLGLKWDELTTRFRSGENMSDILTKLGMSKEDFQKKIIEEYSKLLNQAVKDGKLTQEQVNRMLENFKNRPFWSYEGPGYGGFGRGGKGFDDGDFRPRGGGPGGMRGKNNKPWGAGHQATPSTP